MANETKGWFKIRRAGRNRDQFRVKQVAANGEELNQSEPLHNHADALKNIISCMKISDGKKCLVKDASDFSHYLLDIDGNKTIIN